MANPIRKILQIVFDRAAGQRTENEAKQSISRIDGVLGNLKATAIAVGAAFVAAFSVRKIVEFGKEAINQARNSEVEWSRLAGTVENTGFAFQDVEGDLRALADAFEEATIHGDDDFAQSLNRLITLTGDTSASINNMGLVANVAAQFFNGELAPATELVARVMNGNTQQLQRMGIAVDNAQEGLEILAQRSMGAATRETQTFDGMLSQLNVQWANFQKALGFVLVAGDEAIGVFDVLIATLKVMIGWVNDNADTIRTTLVTSINIAIAVVDAFYRALRGTAEFISGIFLISIGSIARVLSGVTDGYLIARDAAARFLRLIGARETADAMDKQAVKLREQAAALREFTDAAIEAGSDLVREGLSRYATGFQGIGGLGGREAADTGIFDASPMLASGAKGEDGKDSEKRKKTKEEVDRIAEAFTRLEERMRTIQTLESLMGDEFDELSTEASILTSTIETLAAAGLDPADERFKGLIDRLEEVKGKIKELGEVKQVDDILDRHAEKLNVIAVQSEILETGFDALRAEASLLDSTLQALAAAGLDSTDERMVAVADRLREVQAGLQRTREEFQVTEDAASLAGSVIAGAMGSGLGQMAKGKARANLIEAAEHAARAFASSLNPITAPLAPRHMAAAAKHTAIAGAWATFAGSIGTGGIGGGAGGASVPGVARDVGGQRGERSQVPGPELHIYFTGPGFRAVNPEVQRIVQGAIALGQERTGNTKVRTYERNT